MKDNIKTINEMGLSLELHEFSECYDIVYNTESTDNIRWSILVRPPIKKENSVFYFEIIENISDIPAIYSTKKIARINMLCAEYIYCNDCSKDTWILTYQEREKLCELFNKYPHLWKYIIYKYNAQVSYFGGALIDENITMPDYNNLHILPDL